MNRSSSKAQRGECTWFVEARAATAACICGRWSAVGHRPSALRWTEWGSGMDRAGSG